MPASFCCFDKVLLKGTTFVANRLLNCLSIQTENLKCYLIEVLQIKKEVKEHREEFDLRIFETKPFDTSKFETKPFDTRWRNY